MAIILTKTYLSQEYDWWNHTVCGSDIFSLQSLLKTPDCYFFTALGAAVPALFSAVSSIQSTNTPQFSSPWLWYISFWLVGWRHPRLWKDDLRLLLWQACSYTGRIRLFVINSCFFFSKFDGKCVLDKCKSVFFYIQQCSHPHLCIAVSPAVIAPFVRCYPLLIVWIEFCSSANRKLEYCITVFLTCSSMVGFNTLVHAYIL